MLFSSVLERFRTRPPKSWTDFQRLRASGKEPGYRRLNKLEVAALAAAIGVKTPEFYQTFETVGDIVLDPARPRFVLKPDNSKSRQGVMLLTRQSDGTYWDALGRRALTEGEIIDEETKVGAGHRARFPNQQPLRFLSEELLLPDDSSEGIPFDYKLFTFRGEVKFILQVDRNQEHPHIAFFAGEFDRPPVEPAVMSPRGVRPGAAVIPKHAEGILEIARKVSLALETPFVSVDCYSSLGGARLGEITPTPGGPYFGSLYRLTHRTELDMGRAYADAYRALGLVPALLPRSYPIKYRGRPVRQIDWRGLSRVSYGRLRVARHPAGPIVTKR